jgi:hypothetical protein
LDAVQNALKQAKPLFLSDNTSSAETAVAKTTSFRNIRPEDQIPTILEEFIKDFEIQCLEKDNTSAKNYSLFSVTLLKIIKTLDENKKRGLLSAHVINTLDKMLVKHPVKYNKRAIRDPLGLLFVIIELAVDVEKNLSKQYEFDVTILHQLTPLMQRYHMEFDNALLEITNEFKKMPKFRLTVSIGERHIEIIKRFLQDAIVELPLEDKIIRAENILEKITHEENDLAVLEHYNMLKLCYNDKELCSHLSKIAKTITKTNKRFTNTVLDEVSKL